MKKILVFLMLGKMVVAQQSPPYIQIYSSAYSYTNNGFNLTVHPNINNNNIGSLPRYSNPNYTTHYVPHSTPNYSLVFEDNFDALNLDFWSLKSLDGTNSKYFNRIDDNGIPTKPINIEYYSESHVNVAGGKLFLSAAKVNNHNVKIFGYLDDNLILDDGFPNLRPHIVSAGQVVSKQKYKHGIFEIRAKIPNLNLGEYPALWLYGGNERVSELDFLEIRRDEAGATFPNPVNYFFCTYHDWSASEYTSRSTLSESFNIQKPDLASFENEWHTFTTKWDEYKIEWYIDGQLMFLFSHYYRIFTINVLGTNQTFYLPILTRDEYINTLSLIGGYNNVLRNQSFPKNPQNLIMNLQILNTGGMIGSATPPATAITSFANPFEIDYIRIYQNKWCNTNYTNYQRFFDDELPSYIAADNITLEGNNGYKTKVKGQSINSNGQYIGFYGNKVTAVANNRITLGSGFKVENGASFRAKIEDCNTTNFRGSTPMPFLGEEQAFAFRDSLIANLDLDSLSKEQLKFIDNGMGNIAGTTYDVLADDLILSKQEAAMADTLENKKVEINNSDQTSASAIIDHPTKKITKQSFVIYPNPHTGEFVVELNNLSAGNYVLKISDVMGRSVIEQKMEVTDGNVKQKINLTGYSKGVYFVKISGANVNEVRKVVYE